MKSLFILVAIASFSSLANAASFDLNKFACSGSAEYGKVIINSVTVVKTAVAITYTVDQKTATNKYILTEKMKNGSTDANKTAYFIGATKTGDVKDYEDMSLPHLGLYKDGSYGSEIAFNIDGLRVFGTVNCR